MTQAERTKMEARELRAWDGEQYWYLNKDFYFESETAVCDLKHAPFEMKDIEQNTWKKDKNGFDIYEGDRLRVGMSITTVNLCSSGVWWHKYDKSELEIIGRKN